MTDEGVYIACMRRSDMSGDPYPGSTQEACTECGAEIWSEPRIREAIEERHGKAILVCWQCAEIEEMDPGEVTGMLRDSWEAFVESMAKRN